jgi:inhibitor of the pro-sigma K processing machinery
MLIFDRASIFAYVLAAIFFLIIMKIFTKPIRFLLKLGLNSIFGLILLFVVNFLSKYSGIYISINIINALVVGILGVPGILLLLSAKFLL